VSDLYIADISEFQPGVDWATYAAATPAVIIRAHNGRRPDHLWAANAAGASAHCRWWAAYQYLPADVDPAVAAWRFRQTLGGARPNATILDLEEGTGDQQPRQHAWLAALADDDITDWTYTGDYFARAHGLTVDWVAAYQKREPTTAHQLWQFTDKQQFAGIGAPCDGSVFHGTIDDLLALTGNAPVPTPHPHPVQEDDDMKIIVRPDGNKFLFAFGKLSVLDEEGVMHFKAADTPIVDQLGDKSWRGLVKAHGEPVAG
jgi:GH25 family lysozyme M1 (1,4-beta-N-acetylmuramidase)